MNPISPTELMDLMRILGKLVDLNKIEESEMIDILQRSGLTRLPNGNGWLDSNGAVYTLA